jgi:hypothetical protein
VKLFVGQKVWLAAFDDNGNMKPEDASPREPAEIDGHDPDCVTATIFATHRKHTDADGLREFMPNQIEGAAVYMITQCRRPSHHMVAFGRAVKDLKEAADVVSEFDSQYAEWCKGKKFDKHLEIALKHYEGCDVYVDLDGKTYTFTEDNIWEES